jgi:UDP-N-acetylglucosamine--N-acetylmuramyl-(pentapeptide) pyrophosphoryl-undecaprenol N-acetylglucosamine transferase
MTTTQRTILFAGGGSGGHIYPNLAVLERLRESDAGVSAHFLVSNRPVDEQIVSKEKLPFTAVPALPLVMKPKPLWAFYQAYKQSELVVLDVIVRTQASAMVATGGFVSGPAVSAAQKAGIPVALLNLDAVPGRANRFAANKATESFTVYPTTQLRRAQKIGMPLRHSAIGKLTPEKARWDLGLRPDLDTILVFAGSQGSTSINAMMMELCTRAQHRKALEGWQIIHLTGPNDQAKVQQAYDDAQVRGMAHAFCHKMGAVWSAATLAIGRAGAGSVAEAWANAVPTIFMPYPYHKDQHQRLNAEPLISAGAALLQSDLVDPIENVNQIAGPLKALLANETRLEMMCQIMRDTCPPDGAAVVADWLTTVTGVGLARKIGTQGL